jgi:hypothetical protein
MPDLDYMALFGGDDAAAQNQAAALAAAIRGRRAAGTLGLITGDPAMGAVGKEMTGDADKMETSLMGAAQHRAEQQIQGKRLDNQTAQLQSMMGYRQDQVDLGHQRLDLGQNRLQQERDLAMRRLEQQGWKYNQNTGQFEHVGTSGRSSPQAAQPSPQPQPGPSGPLLPAATAAAGGGGLAPAGSDLGPAPAPGPGPAPGGGGAALPPMGGKMLDKALKDLGSDFDPNGGRAGEMGKNQARVNAANRVITLGRDPSTGQARDLTPNQMPEMAQSVASLISGGGAGAQAQIEHLLPRSYSRDVAGILQFMTNEPQGAGQRAFVQQMLETADRERNVATQAVQQAAAQRIGKHQMLIQRNPQEAARALQSYGYDLDPKDLSVRPSAPAAAVQPGGSSGAGARRRTWNPATGALE